MDNKPVKFKNLKLGKPWTEVDSMKLKKLYNNDKKDLAQIAEELGRDKNKIITELIALNLVKEESEVRGINEYKKSDYYKLVQEYYTWQKEEKNNQIKEEKKTIKKIVNNEVFDKEDFKSLNESIKYLVEVVQEQSLNIKLLTKEIENLKMSKEVKETKENNNGNNNGNNNENLKEVNQEPQEEYKTIKYKKKEYILHNNKLYTKTENNKKGLIVGTYEDGKVCIK